MGILKMHEQGNLSEWLRRKIRNLLGFARAGSSPAVVVIFFNLCFVGIRDEAVIEKLRRTD